ncbi:MAG: glycosyltransferase [Candidatus Yonathbacteria bacterium]|nr:glycosyltransferase [Candidatus Yonathbacteria bacterium]
MEAFAKLVPENKNLYYVILGDGQEKEHLTALIERHKLHHRVFLAGFVKDAARYLKALDLFVLPSTTEAIGYVLLEAGLAGLPVVATAVGGIPEIIEDEKGGLLIPPRNNEALFHTIEQMMENPEQRNNFGRILNNTVINNFTIDRMVAETITLYKNK